MIYEYRPADWAENSATLLKKANQRLFCLKKLKSFEVNPDFLELFYHATTETIVTYNSLSNLLQQSQEDRHSQALQSNTNSKKAD